MRSNARPNTATGFIAILLRDSIKLPYHWCAAGTSCQEGHAPRSHAGRFSPGFTLGSCRSGGTAVKARGVGAERREQVNNGAMTQFMD